MTNTQRRLTGAVFAAMLCAGICSCSGKSPAGPEEQPGTFTELNWVGTSVVYHEADGKRDVSIIFVLADWCGWCKRLKTESLADTTVIRILGESYNIVYLNPDADSLVVCGDSTVTCHVMTSEVLNVRGFPTLVFLDRDGDIIGPAPGYRSVDSMIDLLERMKDGEY